MTHHNQIKELTTWFLRTCATPSLMVQNKTRHEAYKAQRGRENLYRVNSLQEEARKRAPSGETSTSTHMQR
jgi:hypothetical protein